jgi:4-hydroxybutyrate CoA-transferase
VSSYQEAYQQKKIDVKDLIGEIKSGETIYAAVFMAEPSAFMTALGEYGQSLSDMTIWSIMSLAPYPILMNPANKVISGFMGPVERGIRKLHGTFNAYAMQYCEVTRTRNQIARPDWSAVRLTTMDQEGYFNFHTTGGTAVPLFLADCECPETRTVVEVNKNLPKVKGLAEFGSHRVHISQVDYVIESDQPLFEMPADEPGEEDRAIARHVADLINDGDTIQIGIGATTDAVISCIAGKKELGVHTEMLGDGLMKLIRSGAVTNSKKTLYPNKTIATFAFGGTELMDWIGGDNDVYLLPVNEVNDPSIISRNHNMVSMNNILTIDLRGQATAHSVAGKTYSGIGGSLEFTYGAQMAPGGRSVLCVHSTRMLSSGRISNIVPYFSPGTAVTIPEFMVDWVATEYGAVRLKTLSIKDRAQAMVSIAHPDFRDELTEQAMQLQLQ